jgi:nitrogen fixation protein NifZ
MDLDSMEPGDMLLAATTISNDGSIPDLPENAVIAEPGTRGVLVNTRYFEEDPSRTLYLVRFVNTDGDLGPPTGCWPDELQVAE